MWTRKRTVIAGRVVEDDWIVRKDGQSVGRVYATGIWDETLSWMWFVQVQPVAQGYAPSMTEALEEVRRRIENA